MGSVHIRGGVTAATLASGPIFVFTFITAALIAEPQRVADLWTAPLLATVSIPFGAIIGLVPNWLGASILANGGRGNVGLRLPVMWLLVGAGAGAAIGALVDWNNNNGPSAVTFMAVVGIACAGVCRLFTRWDD